MRQKLVQDKLRVGNMRLVVDPEFSVNNHVSVAYLDEPVGYDELTNYLGHFSMRRMDLDRPLWHFEVIDGLENGYLAEAQSEDEEKSRLEHKAQTGQTIRTSVLWPGMSNHGLKHHSSVGYLSLSCLHYEKTSLERVE